MQFTTLAIDPIPNYCDDPSVPKIDDRSRSVADLVRAPHLGCRIAKGEATPTV